MCEFLLLFAIDSHLSRACVRHPCFLPCCEVLVVCRAAREAELYSCLSVVLHCPRDPGATDGGLSELFATPCNAQASSSVIVTEIELVLSTKCLDVWNRHAFGGGVLGGVSRWVLCRFRSIVGRVESVDACIASACAHMSQMTGELAPTCQVSAEIQHSRFSFEHAGLCF